MTATAVPSTVPSTVPSAGSTSPTSPTTRRVRRLAVALALVVAGAGVGWAVGLRVRSPADAAAGRAAPTPSPVTAAVERRTLSNDIARRGTIRFDQPTPVALAGAVGDGTGAAIVTRLPARNDTVEEGTVLAEVSGRPVLALSGPQPMYRTIRPGAVGTDVRQLEEALARLGYDPGPADGVFDAAAQAAVQRLYEGRGHQAQGPTKAQAEAVRERRRGVADAEARARQARAALAEARTGSAAAVLAAEQELAQQQRATEIVALQTAKADADAADRLAVARTALDAARRTGTADAIAAAEGAVRTAEADVALVARTGSADRARAAEGVALATARLTEARAPKDTSTHAAAVTAADEDVERARADLDDATAEAGVSIPAGEVVFLARLPQRVDEVKARIGDAPAGPLVTLSGASVRVDTSIEAADAGTVTVGTTVTMRLADVDRRLTGVVTEVADKPGTGGVGAQQIAVVITPDDVAAAAELTGAAVVVTVPLATTAGEVLVVPAAAVISTLDGSTTVKVVGQDGTVRTATVQTGLSAKGAVEVAPLDGATLGPGDRVVIGERAAPPATPTTSTTPTTTGGDRD